MIQILYLLRELSLDEDAALFFFSLSRLLSFLFSLLDASESEPPLPAPSLLFFTLKFEDKLDILVKTISFEGKLSYQKSYTGENAVPKFHD